MCVVMNMVGAHPGRFPRAITDRTCVDAKQSLEAFVEHGICSGGSRSGGCDTRAGVHRMARRGVTATVAWSRRCEVGAQVAKVLHVRLVSAVAAAHSPAVGVQGRRAGVHGRAGAWCKVHDIDGRGARLRPLKQQSGRQ